MDSHTQAAIDKAKKTMDSYDLTEVNDLNEVEMAAAIGRLTATLGMLIATVE